MTPRGAALAVAVAAFALAAAGCGGSSSTAGAGPSPSASPHPSHSPTRTPSSPPVTVTASTSATATVTPTPSPTHHPVSPCATSQLTLSLGPSQGAAGNFYTPLILTNSGTTCTLFGYPGVSYVNAAGAQVGETAARTGGPEATVTVKHGGAASALLHQPDPVAFPPSDCHMAKVSGIRVYPPGQTASLTVTSHTHACTTAKGRSDVTAMQAGTNPQL